MPNRNNPLDDIFAGMENLSDLTPAGQGQVAKGERPNSFSHVPAKRREIFTDRCEKCRGSGNFVGYTGRIVGQCFACKGKGTIDYKSSPAERQQAKVSRDNAKANKALKTLEEGAAWMQAHQDVADWLVAASERGFEFASSLREGINKYGSLTENQLAAARKCMAHDADRAAEKQARIDNAKTIDISKIEQAFTTARAKAKEMGAKGIRWLTLRLDTFKFMDAPANGQWEAAILVREGDAKLGRIVKGKFIRSFACDDPTEARVVAVAADPEAAAIAYGMKYSSCSICGLELTNPESIKRGIGPICAAKFGW